MKSFICMLLAFTGLSATAQNSVTSDTLRLHFVSLKLNTALTSIEQVEQVKNFIYEIKNVQNVDVKAQKIQFSLPYDYQNTTCKTKVEEIMNQLSTKGYQSSLMLIQEQLVTKTPVDNKKVSEKQKETHVQPVYDGTQDR